MSRRNRRTTAQSQPAMIEILEDRRVMSAVTLVGNGGEFPFEAATGEYLGNSIQRDGLYDLKPTVLHEPEDTARPFKMWWLGRASDSNGGPGDRIMFSHSLDGSHWSTPQTALAPQLGAQNSDWGDDHLLGSPSVIKTNGEYYMFYEGYGNWATAINRFFSGQKGDSWITNGTPQADSDGAITANNVGTYGFEESLGIGFLYPKKFSATDITKPVYSGQVTYPNGKINRFLSETPVVARNDSSGRWVPLNSGLPTFHLFAADGPQRQPLYQYFDSVHSNTYTTRNRNGDAPGHIPAGPNHGLIGYSAISLSTPEMIGSLQNVVMMATSSNGETWTRFDGPGPGHSVAWPQNRMTSVFNTAAKHGDFIHGENFPNGELRTKADPLNAHYWDIYRQYGSGYPSALIRDGFLELYFTDDSTLAAQPGGVPLRQVRQRLLVSQIENRAAYSTSYSTRQDAFYGHDIKWSPLLQRYVVLGRKGEASNPNGQSPMPVWSAQSPGGDQPGDFGQNGGNQFMGLLPTSSGTAYRTGLDGAIASNGLGHTLDFPDASTPYTALHLYYEAAATNVPLSLHSLDIDHSLVFLYHQRTAPATPVLTGPAATARTLRLSVTWSASTSAKRYEVQMQNVTTGITSPIATTTALSWTPGANLGIGRYRVRVKAISQNGLSSDWSSFRHFTVDIAPTATSPITPTFALRPVYQWKAVAGAINYELRIQNASGATVLNPKGITATSWTPPANMAVGNYRWQIRAMARNGFVGDWSTLSSFNVGGKTSVALPTATASGRTPTITWTGVTGAARYELRLDRTDVGNQFVVHRTDLSTTSLRTPLLAAGTYRVWVRAISSSGVLGTWSNVVNFRVAKNSPNALPDRDLLSVGSTLDEMSENDGIAAQPRSESPEVEARIVAKSISGESPASTSATVYHVRIHGSETSHEMEDLNISKEPSLVRLPDATIDYLMVKWSTEGMPPHDATA
jgi:hypothetical protein